MTAYRHAPRRLQEISVELTSRCNLSCGMCSVWKGRRDGIGREVLRDVLTDARRLGADVFTPSGAETFMRKDVLDILEMAAELGFRELSVVTNGMLIARHIGRLSAIPGLGLHVSIDGPEAVHDALRGPGSYRAVRDGLAAAAGAGIRTTAKAVLMRPTIDTADHLIDLAVEFGLESVSFQPFQPEIAGADTDHAPWTFPPEDRGRVTRALCALLDRARAAGVAVHTESLFPEIPAYLFDGVRPVPGGGCFLPSRFLLIDGRGEVYPCFFMRGQSMGNVTRGVRLLDIWHGPVQRQMQARGVDGACPGCLAGCSDVAGFEASASTA